VVGVVGVWRALCVVWWRGKGRVEVWERIEKRRGRPGQGRAGIEEDEEEEVEEEEEEEKGANDEACALCMCLVVGFSLLIRGRGEVAGKAKGST